MTLLAVLDRNANGTILRSKLVFLINDPAASSIRRGCALARAIWPAICGNHSAEWVDIDNESNQVP